MLPPLPLAHATVVMATLLPAITLAQPVRANRWLATGSELTAFSVTVDSTMAYSGRVSLRIEAVDDPRGFASVATIVPAAGLQGRRLRVSAMLHASQLGGGGASLWVRADSAGGQVAIATTQGTQRIVGDLPWTRTSVELAVPRGAVTVLVGAASAGSGRLWVDDVQLELMDRGRDGAPRDLGFEPPDSLVGGRLAALGQPPSPREAPRPLSARGLENVEAFARLVGYVRFWYPGDAAATMNWDEFTVRGMRLVEQAPTADSLLASLQHLFAATAPDLVLFPTAQAPAPPPVPRDTTARYVVFWQHCGYGVPSADPAAASRNTVYRSTRRWIIRAGAHPPREVVATGCGPARSIPLPDPDTPFRAELAGGVSALVPLARGVAAPEGPSTWEPAGATERFSLADRATRLADVALLWMVPQHFYPYFDVVPVEWDAALRAGLRRAATDDGAIPFDTTLQRLVAALRDGHGGVYRAGGSLGTPQLALGWVENRVVVIAAGDSAAGRGIRRGDAVLAIDGEPVQDVLARVEGLVSGATPHWVRQVALARLLSGDAGSRVSLRIGDPLDPEAPARDVQLVRYAGLPPAAPRPAKVAELRPGILYVDLDRVTDADIAAALPRLQAARGLVFDMRGYPRLVNTPAILAHLADSAIHSALFEIPLVLRPDHAEMRYADASWTLPPRAPRFRGRVAFLAGSGAISYAESTLGVVEENHLGDIVGEPTAGTNGNINPFSLPGGYTVRWTGLRVRKRDGTPHHGVGIRPTVPVHPTLRGVRAGRDEVLERAVQLLAAP